MSEYKKQKGTLILNIKESGIEQNVLKLVKRYKIKSYFLLDVEFPYIFKTLDEVPVWQRRTRHFNFSSTKECRHGEEGVEEETNKAIKSIRILCKETDFTMPELAIKWILANPALTCTLVGSRNIQELESNVKAIQEPLHKDIKSELDRITFSVMDKLGNHFDYYESAVNDRTK